MGQVPEIESASGPMPDASRISGSEVDASRISYLLIGTGRVSRHFQNYFRLLELPFSVWERADGELKLRAAVSEATHVLLLISDSQIDSFYRAHEDVLSSRPCVHFSGSLVSEVVPSAHPLMTFADSLYELAMYESLPFVLEKNRGDLKDYLPGLKNPSFHIPAAQKSLYHALCVMSGNFTVLLWEKVFGEFERTLGLPKQILFPYLLQTTENLALSPSGATVLTGPLARGDQKTIDRNLRALDGDPFAHVYLAFLKSYEGTAR